MRCRDRKNCTLLIKHAGRGATGMAGRGPFTNDVRIEAVRGLPKKAVAIKAKCRQRREANG